MRNAWVYLDTETHRIEPGKLAPKLVCVQIAEGGGPVSVHLAADPRTHDVVADALRAFRIIGHNVAFDLAVLGNAYPDLLPEIWRAYDEGRVGDTLILAQLFDIASGSLSIVRGAYSLKSLYKRHRNEEMQKGEDSWQLRYAELENVPLDQWPSEAVKYATLDVEATRGVWLALAWNDSARDGLDVAPTFDVQIRAAWALHLASCWGMRCDPIAVAKLVSTLDATQDALRAELTAAGMLRDDGTRDDNAVRQRAESCGVTKRTKGGKTSIDADALESTNDPILSKLREYQNAGKIRTTYLPVVQRGTREPVQARYGLVESGRTSCSNPNLQNLPRNGGVRECFVPRRGCVYVAADYHVVELACLAQVLVKWFGLENSVLARELLQERDLHLTTAAHILGKSYDETVQAYKAGDRTAKDARQLAKGLNFGIPGGLGADKLRQLLRGYGHEVTLLRAKELKASWLTRYPEMNRFFREISTITSQWPDGGAFMRHPITGFVRGGLSYCSAANHTFQHLAAYGAKQALYAVQRACFADTGPLAGCRMVAFVHDEILLEVPEHKCDEAARELIALMEGEFCGATPDVPVKAEAVAMRRWCKEAKLQRDSAGKIVPWEG